MAQEPSPPRAVLQWAVVVEPDKWRARLAGILFITATVASLVSTGLLNPILNSSAYLLKAFANQDRVIVGAFFQLVAAFASAGIAISLYRVLRRHGEVLALGSVAFQVIEGVFYVVVAIDALLFLTLSQEIVTAGAPRRSYFQGSGGLLLALRDRASLAAVFAFHVGALMYYAVFYQAQLIPRWSSAWGAAGVILGLVAALLVLCRVTGYISTTQVIFNLPIGVQEVVLALWLIVKGFNQSAVGSPSFKLTGNEVGADQR